MKLTPVLPDRFIGTPGSDNAVYYWRVVWQPDWTSLNTLALLETWWPDQRDVRWTLEQVHEYCEQAKSNHRTRAVWFHGSEALIATMRVIPVHSHPNGQETPVWRAVEAMRNRPGLQPAHHRINVTLDGDFTPAYEIECTQGVHGGCIPLDGSDQCWFQHRAETEGFTEGFILDHTVSFEASFTGSSFDAPTTVTPARKTPPNA
jgi:hypothetical protein